MQPIILFGGQSYEHEISIVSAIALKKVLPRVCRFIFLAPDRRFYLIGADQMRAEFFASGDYRKNTELFLTRGGFEKKTLLGRAPIEAGTVISIVHGADGEDGKLAALFDFYGVPYVGPRLEASVLSFNKLFTKYLAQTAGVKTLDYQTVRRGEKVNLPYPYILKPLRLGSSIGVSVVKSDEERDYALDVAFEFDTEVLAEPFVSKVREYNLAGCRAGDVWQLSIIEEPAKNDLLDFDQKYLDFARTGKAREAELDAPIAEAIREAFKRVYAQGFDGALIRCDFFVIDEAVYLNEVNPIPGSLSNYLFEAYESTLDSLMNNLPQPKQIPVSYDYIHTIRSAKGKL